MPPATGTRNKYWLNPNRQRGGRPDQEVELLTTLTLNVVHERKNIHGRVPFNDVTNYGKPEDEEPYYVIPRDPRERDVAKEFPYDRFLKLLTDKFGFEYDTDFVIFQDLMVSPHIGGGAEAYMRSFDCEKTWLDILWLMTSGAIVVEPYGDIEIQIKTREIPSPDHYERTMVYNKWRENNPNPKEYSLKRLGPDPFEEMARVWGKPPKDDSSSSSTSSSEDDGYKYAANTKYTLEELKVFEEQGKKAFEQMRAEGFTIKSDVSSSSEDECGRVKKVSMRTKRNLERHAREVAKRYAREEEARQADRERIKGIKFDVNKKDFIPKASRLPRRLRSGSPTPTPSTDDDAGQDPSTLSVPGPSRDTATSRPSRGAASRDQSQAAIRLQLLEDKAQYETEEAQDDDYGAIDQTVIDTFVGAYNTGDSEKAWDICLSFFNIDPDEWSRAEEMRYKQAAKEGKKRKRVPMKKLPGMNVGLFDYQLMGVLNLLRNLLYNVPGGILADEQGVGKTMEMFGLIALAYNLRRSKTEVEAEWNSGKRSQHNPRQDGEKGGSPRTCKLDERYGFRCYCYNGLTQMLADALPEGPNFIIGPERSLEQLYKEGKKKLDTKVLKLRREQDGVDAQDRLTAGEIKALAGNITATGDDTFEYHANTNPKQSEYIIVSHPGQLHKLVQNSFGVKVKTTGDQVVKKSAFLPGMVFMDEFHEFTSAAPQGHETRTVQWLKHLKQNHPPLVYFVSGTPFGESPADIRAAIDMFDNPHFTTGINQRLEGTRLSDFDELVTTFDNLLARQNGGEALPAEELSNYRKLLNKFLNRMMVRRLGIDKFRGRDITDIGPLSVKITDHPAPPSLVSSLQDLANLTRDEVNSKLPEGTSLGNFLRSQTGADLLLKLRLASTFPGISTPLEEEFTFTPSEIASHLSAAKGDLAKTPYYKYIPTWSAYSPKITTILATVNSMLKDKTKIPGESTCAKKLIIFSPLEAESMLIYGYLLYKNKKDKNIKPVWINSVGMDQNDRGKLIDKFKEMGNAPPNILVSPMSVGGTGLNLQSAKYSIVSSPAWSKRENQQAYYRVHRVGQVQDTKLSLLTARWNPADRVLVKKYEGLPVEGSEAEIWGVGDEFAADKNEGEKKGKGKGLVDRHQVVTDEEDE